MSTFHVMIPHQLPSAIGQLTRSRSCPGRLVLVGLVLTGLGCNFLDQGGNSKSRYFDIIPASALATGSWVPMTVRDYTITGSKTGEIGFRLRDPAPDAAVVKVRSSNTKGELVLDAVGDGDTVLSFRANADGKARDDEYSLTVRTAASVSFTPCSESGVYVRGTDGPVAYQLHSAQSELVKGLGLYPVEVLPAEAAQLVPGKSDLDQWVFQIAEAAPAQAILRSTLPNDGASFTMSIIDKTAVDRLAAEAGSQSDYPGRSRIVGIVPYAGERKVCSRLRKNVVSLSPGICRLLVNGKAYDRILDTIGDSVEIGFDAQGACRLAVSLLDLGRDLNLTDITVNPAPPAPSGSSGHHSDWDWDSLRIPPPAVQFTAPVSTTSKSLP